MSDETDTHRPAPEANKTVLARVTCPACGQEGVAAKRTGMRLYTHGPNMDCTGGMDDAVLTALLRAAGLDVRREEPPTGTDWVPRPGNRTRYQEVRLYMSPRALSVYVAIFLQPPGTKTWEQLSATSGLPIPFLQAGTDELSRQGWVRW